MKGFQSHTSRVLKILLIGLLVMLGLLAEQQLRERIQPRSLQVPAPEQSSSALPIRADGPLHEVSQNTWSTIRNQERWVF